MDARTKAATPVEPRSVDEG